MCFIGFMCFINIFNYMKAYTTKKILMDIIINSMSNNKVVYLTVVKTQIRYYDKRVI